MQVNRGPGRVLLEPVEVAGGARLSWAPLEAEVGAEGATGRHRLGLDQFGDERLDPGVVAAVDEVLADEHAS